MNDFSLTVTQLIDRTDRLLKMEEEHREREARLLEPERKERISTRQNFDKNLRIKFEKLNESLLSEELELERKYLKFEENLRNK